MQDNFFVTETDEKYVSRQIYTTTAVIFVILSLLSCFGFFIAWQTFAFFEAISLMVCFVTIYNSKNNKHHWRLQFENDTLKITNLNTRESFNVWDIPASDFIITQTKKEIKDDYCSLAIKNTIFAFGGVKNCKQLKAYIKEHYKQ